MSAFQQNNFHLIRTSEEQILQHEHKLVRIKDIISTWCNQIKLLLKVNA